MIKRHNAPTLRAQEQSATERLVRRAVADAVEYPLDATDPEVIDGLATIATSGSADDLSAGTVPAARMPAHTGDVTSSAGAVALTIPNDTVTYAKMQNVSGESRLLGRGSAGGSGDPEEITLGSGLSMTGTSLAATFTDPWTYVKLASSFATASTTAVSTGISVAGSSFLANTAYEFEALLRVYYDNGTLPTLSFVWPTGVGGGAMLISPSGTITTGTSAATITQSQSKSSGTYWPMSIRGTLYTAGSPGGGTLDIQIHGSAGGSDVVAVSLNSFLKYRAIP